MAQTPRGERQLIILTRDMRPPGLQQAGAPAISIGAAATDPAITAILQRFKASMAPMFVAGSGRPRAAAPAASAQAVAAPAQIFQRVVAKDEQLHEIAAELRNVPTVAAAYVKPAPEPAINTMQPLGAPPAGPHATPDFSSRQDYLGPAPAGIDAHFAWTLAGGKGAGVDIVDVEGEWQLTHEDLLTNNRGVLGGTVPGDPDWRNHGTAVAGVCLGSDNGIGVTGICSGARIGMVSIFGSPTRTTSAAIRDAATQLGVGDILLIELHFPGPSNGFIENSPQLGYIAVEWWPDDYDAIQFAVSRGIIVVEAAGNGAQDLDDTLYDTPAAGFPANWSNPFRRGGRDSGAILVGAGAPPPGTHGRNVHGPDRSRLDFSNYGSAVDVQGWGREVTTCGYGDLQGGSEDHWYTDQFSGTSSASPVVVGALSCLQGICRASGAALLTPATARSHLRATGSPQQAAPGRPASQRIGNRPDLKALIAAAAPGATPVGTV